MPNSLRRVGWPIAVLLSLLLAACGGGDGGQAALPAASAIATDTFNALNLRRQQAGLPLLVRNGALDAAAQGHSDYQQQNLVITHIQRSGNPGFTGVSIGDRLAAAGYSFSQSTWAYGEVLVATGDPRGTSVVEALLAAIYHRFVVLEPRFREIGLGAAGVPGGYTYVTADLAADGFGPALGAGNVAVYPFPDQQGVPTVFYSDNESPDPVLDRNAVGYPVSVQAGFASALTVSSFTIQPRGAAPLPVRLLSADQDADTPGTAAAIIPLDVLSAATIYDVQFVGSAGGQPVSRSWSFTTQ